MKILIMGAGALGTTIGGFLAKAQSCGVKAHDVTLVGREKYMTEIEKHGLKITGIWGEHQIGDLKTATDTKNLKPEYDLILLTTKAFDTEVAMEQIKDLVGNAYVLSLQNGIGNEDIILRYAPDPDKVLGGMVIIGFEIKGAGHTSVTVFADNIKIGHLDGKFTGELANIVRVFNDAKIPADAVGNIQQYTWAKALYNAALNPLGAILGVNYGKLTNESSWKIIEEIIEEAFNVADAVGIDLFWKTPQDYLNYLRCEQIPATAQHKPSMLYDLPRGRTEIDFLNGALVRFGRELGIETPVNETIVNLVKFFEKK